MGIDNYDSVNKFENLRFTMDEALAKCKKDWKTLDREKIRALLKAGVVREVASISSRQDARRYAATRPKSLDDDSDMNQKN